MSPTVISPKKLIEVALPLDAINEAAAAEKNNPFLAGHPRNLHLWWARRPLAAAKAVLFSQFVNDPSWKWELDNPGQIPPGHLKASWASKRKQLFAIISDLVQWDNLCDDQVLDRARLEIRKSWADTCAVNSGHPDAAELFNPERLPHLYDPFAGGGTIPLEAQRLGLEAFASDLNPVAVLINKAMIEIPAIFANKSPVGPSEDTRSRKIIADEWVGATGLAEDVRRYGKWMWREANKQIGRLYPPLTITAELASGRDDLQALIGQSVTVIAWIWVRTVKSPNPAFSHADVPLASTFLLSTKAGKEAYIQPIVDGDSYSFTVKVGQSPDFERAQSGTKLSRGGNFRCLLSGSPVSPTYIKSQGMQKKIGNRLMAVVVEGKRGRLYVSPTDEMEAIANSVSSSWRPETPLPDDARAFTPIIYGFDTFGSLFTQRQLVALDTFLNLVPKARSLAISDAVSKGMSTDGKSLSDGGTGGTAYGDAIAIYLALSISQYTRFFTTFAIWNTANQNIAHGFGRQAIPVTWDFPEANPLQGNLTVETALKWITTPLSQSLSMRARRPGKATQSDARVAIAGKHGIVVSTDPPYYDNVPYADLSDFFYPFLRRSLRDILPTLFSTIAAPKEDELVANPKRHGGKEAAESYFFEGIKSVFSCIASASHPSIPITIYYAFKQSETQASGTASTGWEAFLQGIIDSGLAITGTWPLKTERTERMRGKNSNALASSIVLVCRVREATASAVSRREFIRELNQVLPDALDEMTRGTDEGQSPVAPVDLSQAIIGPGMAVFSKYSAVLEADGMPMTAHSALTIINRFLAEDDFDADTQFCLRWFEQHGWDNGQFGEADVLARAKGTSVEGVKQSGVLQAASGSVRLLKWVEYPTDWNPQNDQRLPVWEVLHQLVRVFSTIGETGAGSVFAAVQSKAEPARQLAYRLYTLCERAGRAEDARAYNELITSWPGIESAAAKEPAPIQGTLFDD